MHIFIYLFAAANVADSANSTDSSLNVTVEYDLSVILTASIQTLSNDSKTFGLSMKTCHLVQPVCSPVTVLLHHMILSNQECIDTIQCKPHLHFSQIRWNHDILYLYCSTNNMSNLKNIIFCSSGQTPLILASTLMELPMENFVYLADRLGQNRTELIQVILGIYIFFNIYIFNKIFLIYF